MEGNIYIFFPRLPKLPRLQAYSKAWIIFKGKGSQNVAEAGLELGM